MTPSAPPSTAALHWAHRLDPEGRGVAYVLHEDAVWVAPSVTELVEGVWHAHPERAHALLRPRIHTTHPRSDVDHAVVQLCARKLCAGVPVDHAGPTDERPVIDVAASAEASRTQHDRRSGLSLADATPTTLRTAVAAMAEAGPLATRARPVVAVLLGADGTVLDAARNTHGTHRLHHAEVNLAQRWRARHDGPFPVGSRIVVSLQCCRMCAAMLVELAPPEGIDVAYLEPETGRFGRHTALQARGWERPLDPFE